MEAIGLLSGIVTAIVGMVVIFGGPALYLYLQVRALWAWQGWWRMAAIPPLVVMALAAAAMVHDFRAGSNLAPLAVILLAPVAAVWLMVFAVARARLSP